jgi:hypothetical protein
MTNTPTDRGYAFIRENADGTKNVYVAVGVAGTAPEDVVAMHLDRQNIAIGSGVQTVAAGAMLRTTEAVHVSSDADGIVFINPRQKNLGPLLKA